MRLHLGGEEGTLGPAQRPVPASRPWCSREVRAGLRVSGISKKPRSRNWMPFQGTMRFGFWQRWSLWRPRSAAGHQARPPAPAPRSLPFRATTQPTLSTTSIFSDCLSVCLLGRATSQLVCTRGLANLTAAVASARPAPQFTDERPDPREAGHAATEPGAPGSDAGRRGRCWRPFYPLLPGVTFTQGPMFLENRTGAHSPW